LTAETIYGGTVTNVKRKRVPGGGSSYSKTTRGKAQGWLKIYNAHSTMVQRNMNRT